MRAPTPIVHRRSRLPGRLTRIAALVLVGAAGWLAAPTPASATTIYDIWRPLRFPASANPGLAGCKLPMRVILTGPGTYRWRVFSAHAGHQRQWQDRTIRLRRAHYQWTLCWYVQRSRWAVYSTLYDADYGGYARLRGDDIKGSYGNGSYHMGSTLDRVR